jgi:hypothetical protein
VIAKILIPFIETLSLSGYVRMLTGTVSPLTIDLQCQTAPIFALCAAALVVVVHACALARGVC